MSPSASQLLLALERSGVRYVLQHGWDNPGIAAPGVWDPSYVILHHTAGPNNGNAPSLGWVLHDNYYPIRACNFLIGRDGTVYVIYAFGCYHAGEGGPGHWGDGPQIPQDMMNHYAYGIEIESVGTQLTTTAGNGYTDQQKAATGKLTAALLNLLHHSTGCAINHKTWALGRKSDTLLPDATWHSIIDKYRTPTPVPPPTPKIPVPQEERMFLASVQYGGNSMSFWLVGHPNGMVGVGSDEAVSWSGPRITVNDEATWRRIIAKMGPQ
jgi:N-acetylmuramoyl-L-alanine amidase